MVGQKDTPSRLTFKSSLTLSLLLHAGLLALLVFGLPGDVERAAGDNPSGAISVTIVTGVADRASAQKVPGTFLQNNERTYNPLHAVDTPAKEPARSKKVPGTFWGGEGGASTLLQQIRNKIERNKYYPLTAKRSQTEGSPLIEFKIKEDGSLAYVNLKKSSGSPVLDEAAAATVRQAAPYPFYPDPIALNIHYTLAR